MKYATTSSLFALAASATLHAQEVTFDLSGLGSWDSPGSPNNVVLTESLGDAYIIREISWTDVVGSGLGGPSWGNEMQMDVNGEAVVQFFPAEGSGSAGGQWGPITGSLTTEFVSSELVIEFFESYDDATDTLDAEYISGTITISYGSAEDCNGNGVEDSEEIDETTDCDSSGVLDECESLTDCDANGVPDVCEGGGVANDTTAGALPLGLNDSVSGSTSCATEETTFGDQCATAAFTGDGPDVFYTLLLSEGGTIDLWTCGSDYDTDLSIHALDGTVLFCDGDSGDDNADDACQTFTSRITTDLTSGDYIVRVGGWQGATGNFVLDSSFSNVSDCNGNGQDDSEDIADGTSADCDGSTVPDECEVDATTDCDGNNILDVCETLPDCDEDGTSDCEAIAGGAQDCDENGVPDSCESDGATPSFTDLSMDTGDLNGPEFVEYTIQLDGDLDSLGVDITFTNGANSEADGTWAGDIAIQITDPSGACVEVGSFNVETCANGILEDFPSDWDTPDNGDYSYTFGLCGQSLSGSGDWTVRLTHGFATGLDDRWNGTLTFGVLSEDSTCPADLSGDGQVGFNDLSIILSNWLSSDGGDVNGDGETNFADLAGVLSAWGSDC